jgi:two-component system OmpR family response regulator
MKKPALDGERRAQLPFLDLAQLPARALAPALRENSAAGSGGRERRAVAARPPCLTSQTRESSMRLLLLEDDRILGEGLRDYLRADGHVVDWFCRLSEARSVISEPYDALLVDWQLPDGSGVDWVRQLRDRGVTTPTLVLTARDLLSDRVKGLDSGADDYLVKPFAPEELAARIRAVRRRASARGAPCYQIGPVEVDSSSRTVRKDGVRVDLTAREWSLLDALVARAGRVVSKTDLDALMTGFEGDFNSNSLEVHVFNLRRKLGHDIIRTVRGLGYRIGP